ncbi:hypothetical protein [Parabacteroides chongii]|nr:hypothetical protein [Parabacteroides chongii]WFE87239.1 hypothetical protein P3L47_23600 [Parabacteroides chongii]
MSNIELFNSIPVNKTEQESVSNQLILSVLDGDVNPIEATVKPKA